MKRHGFTLLEVILVIAMTTVLSGAVIFVYITAFKAWNAGQDRSEVRTELALALEGVSRDIGQAREIVVESANSLKFIQGTTESRLYLYSADDPSPAAYNQSSYQLRKSSASESYGAGTVLANGVHPTVFSYNNKVLTIDLTATQDETSVHMRTRIRPRNS